MASRSPAIGECSFTIGGLATALLKAVLRTEPRHPHALHLLVHLNDAPRTAFQAQYFGRSYAAAAPSAYHAVHMPSHLALRLGRFAQAESENEHAVGISEAYINEHPSASASKAIDSHSAEFLHFAFLQSGRFAAARRVLAREVLLNHTIRTAMMAPLQAVEEAFTGLKDPPMSPQMAWLNCPTCDDPRNLDNLFLSAAQANAAKTFAHGLLAALSPSTLIFGTGAAEPGEEGSVRKRHEGSNHTQVWEAIAQLRKLAKKVETANTKPFLLLGQYFREVLATQLEALQLRAEMGPPDTALQNNQSFGAQKRSRALEAADRAHRSRLSLGPAPYGWPIASLAASDTLALLLLEEKDFEGAQRALREAGQDCENLDQTRALWLFGRSSFALGLLPDACRAYKKLRSRLRKADPGSVLKADAEAWWAETGKQSCITGSVQVAERPDEQRDDEELGQDDVKEGDKKREDAPVTAASSQQPAEALLPLFL